MKVKFWGVRGSIPVPGPATARYGGNTTCIEVRADDGTLIVLDAGTGIFQLAQDLLRQMPITANIFITHSHWDHIQGLPFFTPIYIPGNTLRIHGGRDMVYDLGINRVMDVQMQYSYFPIREAQLNAAIAYIDLNPYEPVTVGPLTVTPMLLSHPVTNFGYRIDGDGKSMFFTGDHEPWYNMYKLGDDEFGAHQLIVEERQSHLDQALTGIDLLIADSAYTAAEYPSKVDWGHGTIEGHLAWARRIGVKQLICTHHEPTRSDDALEKVFSDAVANCRYVPGVNGAPQVQLAREGLEIQL